MDNEIQQVKDKTDIATLISQYLPLKKSGRNYKGLCPFHGEKTPSFMVSPELQIFKCFGCGRGGDVFAFLKEQEGWEFGEALSELAKRAGVKLLARREEKSPEEDRRERIFAANELAANFYHFLLTQHKVGRTALDYLKKRGLKKETIEKFRLGYAAISPDSLTKFLQKKGFSLSEILEAGLALSAEGSRGAAYDRFRGRIVFPLFDASSRVVGFSGRSLSENPDVPKYLNSPETPIFHKSRFLYGLNLAKGPIRKLARVILVEGQMDLVSNVQAGIENIVATSGSAFTTDQVRILKKLAKEIVLCFDGDEAGQKALVRAIEVIEIESSLSPLVGLLPEGAKDPDEAITKNPETWKKNLVSAQSFYDYYLDLNTRDLLPSDSLGQRRATEKLLPVLGRIADPLQRSHFGKKLAEKLDLPERFVAEALDKFRHSETTATPPLSGPHWQFLSGTERLETLRQYLLALLLRFEIGLVKRILPKVSRRDFGDGALAAFFDEVKGILTQSQKTIKISLLQRRLGPEAMRLLEELLLFDLGDLEGDLNLQEKEIGVALRELLKESLRAQAAQILLKIKQAESQNQRQDFPALQKELNRLYQRLGKVES